MDGHVPTKRLWEQCYNALLYSHKNTVAQGYTLWQRGGDRVSVCAFDDYFAISDQAVGLEATGEPSRALLSLDDLKALEKHLRDESAATYDLDDVPFDLEFSTWTKKTHPEAAELFIAESFCYPEGYLEYGWIDFLALSPDRLRKLSLLKPQGYPIDFAVFSPDDHSGPVDDSSPAEQFVGFRYGPWLRGAIAPLNRDDLKEIYTGEELWRSIPTRNETDGGTWGKKLS